MKKYFKVKAHRYLMASFGKATYRRVHNYYLKFFRLLGRLGPACSFQTAFYPRLPLPGQR